ncbi:MAG TPA: histidine kinase [Bryobacteraceae bacterium]|nr:histidine kinase [Bryobacteraceae bacterium]
MPDAMEQSATVWRDRDLARVARRLHDRIGPALCAAGLQLSLIEQSAPPSSDAAEAIAGLRQALTASTDEVRTLSYLCDPSLVARLGFKAAMDYLARAVPLDPGGLAGLPSRKDPAVAGVFSLLRRSLLYWAESAPNAAFAIEARPRSIRVNSTHPAPEDLAEFLRRSGVQVPAARMSATLKIPAGAGGARR